VLIALGTLLDDMVPTELYPKRRDGTEEWGWTPDGPEVGFTCTRIQHGSDPGRVAVLLSVSGTVDRGRMPEEIDHSYTFYELVPTGTLPAPALITNSATLDAFSHPWWQALATIEAEHPGAEDIGVFPVVPAAAAVNMGRHLMRVTHPPLCIFDRIADHETYQYTTSTLYPNS